MLKRSSDNFSAICSIEQIQVCLRDSTRASHRAIDHHPLLAPLVKPTLTLDHYKYVLTVMNWMHLHLSERLAEAMLKYIPTSQFFPSDRLNWLAKDLEWLDMDMTPAPKCIMAGFKPDFASAEALVGALYVIEGSTLGGQFIAQQLANSIQVYPGKGASFFHGHGADTGSRWNDFWTFAASVCLDDSLDEVCAAAGRMFGEFESMLNSCIHRRLQIVTSI
jgi:heme oxygenase